MGYELRVNGMMEKHLGSFIHGGLHHRIKQVHLLHASPLSLEYPGYVGFVVSKALAESIPSCLGR